MIAQMAERLLCTRQTLVQIPALAPYEIYRLVLCLYFICLCFCSFVLVLLQIEWCSFFCKCFFCHQTKCGMKHLVTFRLIIFQSEFGCAAPKRWLKYTTLVSGFSSFTSDFLERSLTIPRLSDFFLIFLYFDTSVHSFCQPKLRTDPIRKPD